MLKKEDKDGQIRVLKEALLKIYNNLKDFGYKSYEYDIAIIADNALRECTF